jgi:hypothetical protein
MITIYEINVQSYEHKIVFEGLCDKAMLIDRMSVISPSHQINVGWVEIYVCDQLLYKGPYPWFKNGDMNFSMGVYMNFKIIFTVYDEIDKWFHGSHVRLICQYANGDIISTNYKGRFDEYTK